MNGPCALKGRLEKEVCNELLLISIHYRGSAHGRQHSVDHEQGLLEQLSLVVRSDVHCPPPHKNSAPCLIGPDMPQAQSFYEGRSFVQGLIWWFVMERIGQGLRERYEVPNELPPKLQTLVRKIDDRDWLFPCTSWHEDVDLLSS